MVIICNTYDGNSDLWPIWVRNWEKFAIETNSSIVVNNELTTLKELDQVTWASALRGVKRYPIELWSDHLRDLLVCLEDDYLVLAQDDYLLDGWNSTVFRKMLKRMERENDIDCIHLSHQVRRGLNNEVLYGKYFLNTQVAIWRRSSLIEALVETLNPWCWELRGHKGLKRKYRILFSTKEALQYRAIIKQGRVVEDDYNIDKNAYDGLVRKKGLYKRSRLAGKLVSVNYLIKCIIKR